MPESQRQLLIGRYAGSPESIVDSDLSRLQPDTNGAEFAALIAAQLTNDFWTVTLPANLESSAAGNPELFADYAAQNRLAAPVLFSHKWLTGLLDPAIKTKKSAIERHHLLPRAWLESQGITDQKQIDQTANYASLEWPEDLDSSDTPPAEYVPAIQPRFTEADWARMHELHALPANWHTMTYADFLDARRKRMAAIIRRGFESLKHP